MLAKTSRVFSFDFALSLHANRQRETNDHHLVGHVALGVDAALGELTRLGVSK
jgi:hypothetical protein